MAVVKVRGYANFVKKNDRGWYASLSESVKQKDGSRIKVNYNISSSKIDPPDEGAFVDVEGYLSLRSYKNKEGVEVPQMAVYVLEVKPAGDGRSSSGKAGTGKKHLASSPKSNTTFSNVDDDEIPF